MFIALSYLNGRALCVGAQCETNTYISLLQSEDHQHPGSAINILLLRSKDRYIAIRFNGLSVYWAH